MESAVMPVFIKILKHFKGGKKSLFIKQIIPGCISGAQKPGTVLSQKTGETV